jgi:hypothetical protein
LPLLLRLSVLRVEFSPKLLKKSIDKLLNKLVWLSMISVSKEPEIEISFYKFSTKVCTTLEGLEEIFRYFSLGLKARL